MAIINGGPGQWLPGTDGQDTINATGDSNSLFGGSEGNPRGDRGPNFLNILNGGSNNNLVGSVAVDHFNGGTGINNIASYQLAPGPVTASLANPSINTGDAAGDTYTNIFMLTGTLHGATLYGDTSGRTNQLWGLGGTNSLFGASGYTTFISGLGADAMVGGAGRGLIDYETAGSGVIASIANPGLNTGEAAGDTYSNIWDIAGSRFDDILYGDSNGNNFLGGHTDDRGNDTFHGFAGNDTFTTGRGADTMFGGSGGDLFLCTIDDLTDAREGLLNRIGDYNQGNSGGVDVNEFDRVDLSQLHLTSSAVRAIEDSSNTFAILQINDNGTWRNLARMDGLHSSDSVRVVLDNSQPFGTLIGIQPSGAPPADGSGQVDIWKMSNGQWAGSVDVGTHWDWQVGGIGDFSGDGTDDVLWRHPTTGWVDIWKMSNGQWAGSVDVGTHWDWQVGGIGDFNGDGTDDVLWHHPTTGWVDIWKMSNGQWAGSVDVGTHWDWQVGGIGDFNGDGTDDVLWHHPTTGWVDIWKMSNGQWAGSVDVGTHWDWQVGGIGDFNGDGTDDVLWHHPTTGWVDIWKMSNGQWAGSVDVGTHWDWQVGGIGDFNGDGTDDVLWRHPTTGWVDIWKMSNGQWAGLVDMGSHGTDWIVAGIGDFNKDHTDDVFWLL